MKRNEKKLRERRREKAAYSRLWFRLRPSRLFARTERRFFSERERREYDTHVARLRARMILTPL